MLPFLPLAVSAHHSCMPCMASHSFSMASPIYSWLRCVSALGLICHLLVAGHAAMSCYTAPLCGPGSAPLSVTLPAFPDPATAACSSDVPPFNTSASICYLLLPSAVTGHVTPLLPFLTLSFFFVIGMLPSPVIDGIHFVGPFHFTALSVLHSPLRFPNMRLGRSLSCSFVVL